MRVGSIGESRLRQLYAVVALSPAGTSSPFEHKARAITNVRREAFAARAGSRAIDRAAPMDSKQLSLPRRPTTGFYGLRPPVTRCKPRENGGSPASVKERDPVSALSPGGELKGFEFYDLPRGYSRQVRYPPSSSNTTSPRGQAFCGHPNPAMYWLPERHFGADRGRGRMEKLLRHVCAIEPTAPCFRTRRTIGMFFGLSCLPKRKLIAYQLEKRRTRLATREGKSSAA